ncbi:hypothetical protein [Streptomyces sp. NPDC127105]|uniref:hypothetical protein n=1 Tax=Streptomyces sp. NPDC127105 TaxID=3345359 RepID=UPI00366263AC
MRDLTFGEDACWACAGGLPCGLARFRSLAIALARLTGRTDDAAARDHYRNPSDGTLRVLGFMTRTRIKPGSSLRKEDSFARSARDCE